MVRCKIGDAETSGAGIIVGQGPDRLYVATANHVLRSGTASATALEIMVRWMPGEWHPATVTSDFDQGLDLAVIAVPNAGALLKQVRLPVARLAADIKRTQQVFPIGYAGGTPWFMRVTPDLVSDVATDSVKFETGLELLPGQSGGALVNGSHEIVGLVKNYATPLADAIPMTRVLEWLQQRSYPVFLRAASAATSTTPTSPKPLGPGESVPDPNASCVVALIAPDQNAVLPQVATVDGKVETRWRFAWSACPGAMRYHLFVIGPGARNPAVNLDTIQGTSHEDRSTHYGIPKTQGWTWRVRAFVNGAWTAWSETRIFDVGAPRSASAATDRGDPRPGEDAKVPTPPNGRAPAWTAATAQNAEGGIEHLLARYAKALSVPDWIALRLEWPSVNTELIRFGDRGTAPAEVVLSECERPVPRYDTATVTCLQRITWAVEAGASRPTKTVTSRSIFYLRRTGGRWVIEDVLVESRQPVR